MKPRFFLKLTFSLLINLLLFYSVFAQKHYKDIKYPKLNKINVPDVERVELSNGMILFLVEDHELPLITVSARIGVGSIYEPVDKIGLASITGSVMRTGGSVNKSGDEIDEELESIAASVETGIGASSGFASMSVLKENLDTGLAILADILINPAFPDDKIDLEKVQQKAGIARRNDDVQQIAGREFNKLIYGVKSVYARHTEYETIDSITREDLVAFHKKYYHPNNTMLGIWGDFKANDMVKTIESVFKNWKRGEFQQANTPPVNYNFDYSVNVIPKDDVNQSNIFIGHIGGMLNNPDYFALRVMNQILSGSFASRLFSRVRSDQGLAYAVFGQYGANYDYPGQFYVGCMTKSETTIQAVRSLLHEVELMKTESVTDEELALAKESYFNKYVFNFDTKSEVVSRLMTYEYYGYPNDFLQQTKDNIEKVTKADVQRVAQKYLQPDKVRILVVGKVEDFDEPLSVLGTVNEIDITIPTPKEEMPEATSESLAKGMEIFSKTVSACGGRDAYASINNYTVDGSVVIVTPQGDMQATTSVTFVPPDKLQMVLKLPFGEMTQVLSGDKAWVVSPQGSMDMPNSQRDEMKGNLFRDWVILFRLTDADGMTAQYVGSGDVNGKNAEIIFIKDKDGNTTKLFVDAKTFKPLKQVYSGTTMTGSPAEFDEFYPEMSMVNGVLLPMKLLVNANGEKFMEMTFSEIKINQEVDPATFQK